MEDNPSRGEEGNPVQEQAGTYYQKVDLELQVTFRHLAGAPREAQSLNRGYVRGAFEFQ